MKLIDFTTVIILNDRKNKICSQGVQDIWTYNVAYTYQQ